MDATLLVLTDSSNGSDEENPEKSKKQHERQAQFFQKENHELRRLAQATGREQMEILDTWTPHVTWMLQGLSSLSDISGTVYRGMPMMQKFIKAAYYPGQRVKWCAFTSTTFKWDYGVQRARRVDGKPGAVMVIRITNGKDISEVSVFGRAERD